MTLDLGRRRLSRRDPLPTGTCISGGQIYRNYPKVFIPSG